MKGGEKAGGFGRVVESWWRGPAVFATVYWGGAGLFFLAARWMGVLLGGQRGAVLFLCMLLVWLAVAVLPPVLVVAQLVRRKWGTALVTAALSVVAMVPLIQAVLLMWALRGGLAK